MLSPLTGYDGSLRLVLCVRPARRLGVVISITKWNDLPWTVSSRDEGVDNAPTYHLYLLLLRKTPTSCSPWRC